jgi:hypothetical protein
VAVTAVNQTIDQPSSVDSCTSGLIGAAFNQLVLDLKTTPYGSGGRIVKNSSSGDKQAREPGYDVFYADPGSHQLPNTATRRHPGRRAICRESLQAFEKDWAKSVVLCRKQSQSHTYNKHEVMRCELILSQTYDYAVRVPGVGFLIFHHYFETRAPQFSHAC